MSPTAGSSTSPPASSWDVAAILDALDPEQRVVASELSGPMRVRAGAGTGKTRAITHRIAHGVHSGVYEPHRVLAVTFTARAAGEMRTRLRDLGVHGVQARTFHSAALRQLHYFWPQAVGGGAPEVLSHKAPVVAAALARLRLDVDRAVVRDVSAEIEWAKVTLLTPATYPEAAGQAGREPPGMDAYAMSRVLETYESVKSERGVIDFEDVLLLTVGMLDAYPQIAATVRGQYRQFVVDEYQDVSPLQHRLLLAWLGDRHEVCVVGDPAQTIYSFTGASSRYLESFTDEHPGANTISLVRNYRSTTPIVSLANSLLAIPGGGRRSGSVVLRAQQGQGPPPTALRASDEPAEAAKVAGEIERLVADGTPAAEIAILFRTNAQSEVYESALTEAGIPYLVRGGERFFARPEVREAMVLLRGAARADDGTVPLPQVVRDTLSATGWTPAPPAGSGAVRERWESVAAVAALADDIAAVRPESRLADVVRDLDERAAAAHAPTTNGVTLASLHAAKGLEWDVVFLVGCSDGYLPITMAHSAAELEEERRLLYVGVTRARRRLFVSWADARHPGGRATRRPSRFLDASTAELGGLSTTTATAKTGSRRRGRPSPRASGTCRVCGKVVTTAAERKLERCTQCPASYDEELLERLKAWRLERARDQKVPAFVIFTDATLQAMAERRPGALTELAAINGVGPAKLARYGPEVLDLLTGTTPPRDPVDQPDTPTGI